MTVIRPPDGALVMPWTQINENQRAANGVGKNYFITYESLPTRVEDEDLSISLRQ